MPLRVALRALGNSTKTTPIRNAATNKTTPHTITIAMISLGKTKLSANPKNTHNSGGGNLPPLQ
jgi:hypothetical protein